MTVSLISCGGIATNVIKAAEIGVTLYTAKVAKDTQNTVRVIQKCPRWLDPFLPDDDYKERWTRNELEQLLVYNQSYLNNCVDFVYD